MAMFGNRKANYVKSDDASATRDERLTRLKFELREHIRFLADYEIMSTDWLRMAESLHQIANVAFMETHLPPSEENPLAQKGKKEQGTLWDQERDELAIRILLEEGKLNLALRILHKYKTALRAGKLDELIKAAAKKFNSDAATVTERCRVFEQSVGILLKFALAHVEALQIIDLPELLQHCKEVLQDAVKSEKKENADGDKLQETLFIHYLHSLGAKLEEMDEDAVMDLVEKENIIPLFIQQMQTHYGWYKLETLAAAAKFLSHMFGSEAYTTEKNRFIPSKEVQKQCLELKGLFVAELVSTYGLKKKEVQALLDQLDKWEVIHGAPKVTPLKKAGAAPAAGAAADEKKDGGAAAAPSAAAAAAKAEDKPAK